MPTHRLSFWTTTASSAVVALALSALMVWVVAWGWSRPAETALWPTVLGLGLAELVILPIAALSGLVATGGLVALWRDSLEAKGLPYAPSAPLEAPPTRPFAAMRSALFGLCAGDTVEIKRLDEIMPTLDASGALGGVPFMPEMAAFCGTRARVLRRVDKLNDWIRATGMKRMRGLVILDGLRCDGAAHGNCQSSCHLRWREEWLRRVDGAEPSGKIAERTSLEQADLAALSAFSKRESDAGAGVRYVCQATELVAGGTPLRQLDPRHYARDLLTGNVRLKPLCIGLAITLFNRVQRKIGGAAFPKLSVGTTKASPQEALNLQRGDFVRIKSKDLIEGTLNSQSRNSGLYFDREMLRFCGGEYRVKARLERVVVEKTGELRQLTNPCVILEGVIATGEYEAFNPEDEFIFWREVWLERVAPSSAVPSMPSRNLQSGEHLL
jgi:hypothetical protein